MNILRYYTVVNCDNDSPFAYYLLEINWNIEEIAGYSNASGYIVQKVKISNTLGLKGLDNEYFEAWPVENGKLKLDRSDLADDTFEWLSPSDALSESVGKRGRITYNTQVFWVDRSDPLYNVPNSWEEGTVCEAGNLKSILAKDCKEFERIAPAFEREFIHVVDFDNWSVIKESIVFGYTQYADKKVLLLRDYANQVLSGTKYECYLPEFT